jgi:hypothetical protein
MATYYISMTLMLLHLGFLVAVLAHQLFMSAPIVAVILIFVIFLGAMIAAASNTGGAK